jgi:polysaccharide export outer membrane protein
MMQRRSLLLGGASAALLSGCDVPRGAPMRREVLRGANDPESDFAVRFVEGDALGEIAAWPAVNPLPNQGWIGNQRGSPIRRIADGDRLSVSIWDSEDNSLITPPGERVVALQDIRVAPDGTIFIPYVGDVRVAGLSEQAARRTIEEQMTAIVPQAQVQLALQEGRANSAEVVSGVNRPGRYPLEGGDRTVLSLIAEAGGVRDAYLHPLVRLHRNGSIYLTSVKRLFEDPRLDTTLIGGDRLVVFEDPRSFVALGAAGRETRVVFDQERMLALDAVARIGGLAEGRADLEGVLILREYPAHALGRTAPGPERQRMVFVLNLASADGLFAARNFEVMPGDTMFVTESPVTTVESAFGIVNSTFSTARRVNAGI